MTTSMEGLTVRTGLWRREFVPFDEMQQVEADAFALASGQRHGLGEAAIAVVKRALRLPAVTGQLGVDGPAFTEYVTGAWSPARAAKCLVEMAQAAGASDVHLESERLGVVVSLRCLGELMPLALLPGDRGIRLFAALKQVSGCLPYRRDIPQEGRLQREGVAADVRTSFLPTALGERAALRLFGRLLTFTRTGNF